MTDTTATIPGADELAAQALGQSTSTTTDEVAQSDAVAQTLTALQNLIERHAQQLDEIGKQLKEHRESLRSIFDNDTELGAAEEQAKAFSTQVKQRKSQLQSDATAIRLKNTVAELNEQKKEIEESLSNHLVNYYQLTNSTSFDTSDGDQREFVIRARVKPGKKAA